MVSTQQFSVEDLGELAPVWDGAVDRTPRVDGFCTSTLWSFAAATSFPAVAAPRVVGDGVAFCGMRLTSSTEGHRVLVGLDPVWGFASPLVGPPAAAAAMLADRLALDDFDYAVVAAQHEESPVTAWVARTLGDRFRLLRGPDQERLRIDLLDGVDAWLSRRSGRFRQRLRQLRRAADDAEVSFDDVSAMAPDELFDRILAVEASSWKAAEATGLNAPELAGFYRQMCCRLAARDQLRALLARIGERDVGYILGGVRGDTYRGLQLSYADEVARLGLGHLLQLEQLERLVHEGVAVYDLGMDMTYKRRWADRTEVTFSLVVAP